MPLSPPADRRRPAPEPVQSNERAVIWAGIVVWAALLVLALVRRRDLIGAGHEWWIWTPVYGIALGLIGIGWLTRRGR